MGHSVSPIAVAAAQAAPAAAVAQADLSLLMNDLTVDGTVAGRLLKLSRNTTYKALRSGEIPSVRIRGQWRVPTAKLREMLGLPHPSAPAPIAA